MYKRQTLTSEAESEFFKANLLRGRGAPIGFTDVKQEGKWEWITGEIGVTGQNDVFTDWEPLEPNNALGCAGEDVAVFYPSAIDTLQRWNDVHPETAPDHYCFPTIPLPDNDLIVEFGYIKSP